MSEKFEPNTTIKRATMVGLALICTLSAARAAEDRPWHFLTVTRGGAVSLTKDLTEQECDHLRTILPQKSWECDNPEDDPNAGKLSGTCYTSVEPSDFVRVECFQ